MNLPELHRRLLIDTFAVGARYPLALAGGYAVRAHGLVDRLGRDLDFATESPEGMEEIAATVGAGLEERGWRVRVMDTDTDPLFARLVVSAPGSEEEEEEVEEEECEIKIFKETLWRPPVLTEYGLVLSLEDLVGTKVRALSDRGLARDLIDVHAAADHWSHPELEELGRRHARAPFDLTDLQARLTGAEWIDDAEFRVYGLDGEAVAGLRRWAQEWNDDIAERLAESEDPQDD